MLLSFISFFELVCTYRTISMNESATNKMEPNTAKRLKEFNQLWEEEEESGEDDIFRQNALKRPRRITHTPHELNLTIDESDEDEADKVGVDTRLFDVEDELNLKANNVAQQPPADQCWVAMSDVLTPDEMETAKQQTKNEANDNDFKMRLLNRIIKTGVTGGTGGALKQFEQETDANAYLQAMARDPQHGRKRAIFILGPSSSGKTTVAASIPKLLFPLMKVDGADWREQSKVWEHYAQHLYNHNRKKCQLKDYFKKVFQKIKPEMHTWMMAQINKHKPMTVLFPSTAVPCIFPKDTKRCKIAALIEYVRNTLGYEVSFVVIHADKNAVVQKGTARAQKEGKKYSASGYELAYVSALRLMDVYPTDKYEWKFYTNSFDSAPQEITEQRYLQHALPIVSVPVLSGLHLLSFLFA